MYLAWFSRLNEPIISSDLRNSVKIVKWWDWSPNRLRLIGPQSTPDCSNDKVSNGVLPIKWIKDNIYMVGCLNLEVGYNWIHFEPFGEIILLFSAITYHQKKQSNNQI